MRKVTRRDVAIILGSRFPALGVVDCLTSEGIRCIVCDTKRLQAGWSRHARFRRVPDPQTEPLACASRISAIAQEEQDNVRCVIIPTDDAYARLVAHHRDMLCEAGEVCAADSDVVDLLTDKQAFAVWASEHELDVPRAVRADGAVALRFPFILKPLNFSAFLKCGQLLPVGVRPSDLRFTLLRDREEWEEFRHRFASVLEHLVAQEYVEGSSEDMYSIGLYADAKSSLRGLFVGRKIRGFPASYGNTVVGQNDEVPPELITEIERILRVLHFRGIAEFEYLRERATGRFVLIEINPRPWSWIVATQASPANIPAIAFRDLIGLPSEIQVFNERPGVIKSVRLLSDALNVFWRYRSDRPDWVMSPTMWWRSLDADRRIFVEFRPSDPLVTLFCALLALRDLIRNER